MKFTLTKYQRKKRDTNTFNDWSIDEQSNGWDQLGFHLRIYDRISICCISSLQCQSILWYKYIYSRVNLFYLLKWWSWFIPKSQHVCIVFYVYLIVMIDHNHESVLYIDVCYVRMMQPSIHEQLHFRVLLKYPSVFN
jgi:hypothetical protein